MFNQVVLKKLFISSTTQSPLFLPLMIRRMKLPGQDGKTTVVVGVITQDMCVQEVLKLKVCAQCVSNPGNPLFKTRGKILTLD